VRDRLLGENFHLLDSATLSKALSIRDEGHCAKSQQTMTKVYQDRALSPKSIEPVSPREIMKEVACDPINFKKEMKNMVIPLKTLDDLN
jgi:hypothetical protein